MPAVGSTVDRSRSVPRSQHAAECGSECILVVEDETQVRELVVRVLSRSGYQVKAGESAEEAESIIDACDYHPDLVLTDVILPGGASTAGRWQIA
jgi:two-component system OmpR family response regulator